MAYFALLQFEHWDETDVADWLNGLDDAVHQYIPNFLSGRISGPKLLMLSHSDLEKLGITKLGHQELILEAVDLLKSLRYTFETENLQHLALQLGCKARSLYNEMARSGENDPNRANVQSGRTRKQLPVPVSTLSAVCDIMSTMKTLVSWLDRAPFETIHAMSLLRNSLVKLGLELVTLAQKEPNLLEVENAILKQCLGMTEYCDELTINMKESLVVQPASLEIATIRKKQGDELGMNIQSSYFGIHVIGCIKDMSPADLCSKIEKGDEVLQVNNQTVLGWQLAKLVAALREKPKEVVMLLKKRPRHTTPFGHVPNKRLSASRHVPSVATLPKPMKKRRSKDGEKPARPTLQEYVTSSVPTGDIYITKESPDDPNDGNDTDNDVFRSGSESPQFTLPVISTDAKQRRATVSGGSPTFERLSLVSDDLLDPSGGSRTGRGLGHNLSLDPPPPPSASTLTGQQQRPKSQAINAQEKEAAIAALLAAAGPGGDAFSFALSPQTREDVKSPSTMVTEKKTTELNPEDPTPSTNKFTDTTSASRGADTAKDPDPKPPKEQRVPPKPAPRKSLKNTPSVESSNPTSHPGTAVDPQREKSSEVFTEDMNEKGKVDAGGANILAETGDSEKHQAKQDKESGKKVVDSPQQIETERDSQGETPEKIQDFMVHKPTPVLRQNALGDSEVARARKWNQPRIVSSEVAGNAPRSDVPLLKRIKRLDSGEAADLESKMEDDDVFDKPQKKVGFSEDSKTSEPTESYYHIVVGGVVQRIPVDPKHPSNESAVKMRPKAGGKTKLDRRISCKDLGRGDCEGWLYKRKQKDRTLSKHWDKRWCVLKYQDLYYYRQRDAEKAEGVIHLPAFQVSPATNLKTKKFAFKIHNAGTTFYFASERQEDMSKWMNKLGLAAIKFEAKGREIAGFNTPTKTSTSTSSGTDVKAPDYSESEEEGEDLKWQGSAISLASNSSLASSSGSLNNLTSPRINQDRLKDMQKSIGASTEELQTLLHAIQTQDLTIDGKDKTQQRYSQLGSATSDPIGEVNPRDRERVKKLQSLQRTLKAKEAQLQVMENLMTNPAAIRDLQDFVDISGTQETSNDSVTPKPL